jgi:DMSO/TMAO reductase YedYZ heme-binding membrane subunit
MKKAWDDIKSFVTVFMTLAYIVLTFLGKMTPEFQNIFVVIIAFYFGTQAEKLANKMKDGE